MVLKPGFCSSSLLYKLWNTRSSMMASICCFVMLPDSLPAIVVAKPETLGILGQTKSRKTTTNCR